MKIMMIDIIDGALIVYPTVVPTLFVDDVSAERAAEAGSMIDALAGFTLHVGRSIDDAGMELSDV